MSRLRFQLDSTANLTAIIRHEKSLIKCLQPNMLLVISVTNAHNADSNGTVVKWIEVADNAGFTYFG